MLLTGDESVLDVALACGFQSHEAFCRAFRRRFGMTPKSYRERGFAATWIERRQESMPRSSARSAPASGFFTSSENRRSPENEMAYSITKKELAPQPVLIVRRRVKRSEIAATIGEALPHIFIYAQQNGIALAGLPFTRYVEMGPGLITMEPGMRVTSPGACRPRRGRSRIRLPGGPAATTIHAGPTINSPRHTRRSNSGWRPKGWSRQVHPGSPT